MSLYGIDISNHQSKMDLGAVLDRTNTSFVILKATEGVTFKDGQMDKFLNICKGRGVRFGLYHFARSEKNTAQAEASWFYERFEEYIRQGLPILDWESSGMANVKWAKQWLDYIYKWSGVKPVIYMPESAVNAYNWSSVANAGYGLWVAKYRDHIVDSNYNMSTAGKAPSVKWWPFYMMWQWTSSGRLSGYSGNLDCNIFYGDKDAWDKYVGYDESTDIGQDTSSQYAYISAMAQLPVLRKGAKCNAVRLVQMVTGANVDGDFGPKTEAKVKEFEKKYGLVEDGLVDETDWKVILDWLATV